MHVLTELPVQERVAGWDTVGDNYALIKARLTELGKRKPKKINARPQELLDAIAEVVPAWKKCRFGKPIMQAHGRWTGWATLHPVTKEYGVSADLVALVEAHHPDGEWRRGRCTESVMPFIVARVVDGELVAFLAPCHRDDARTAALNTSQRSEEDHHA